MTGIAETKICRVCGADNDDKKTRCRNCGQQL